MESLLIYLARSFFCLGALYIIWWLFMSKDTFFMVNRFYLISSIFFSLILPIFDFSAVTFFGQDSTRIFLQAVTIRPEDVQNVYESNLSVFQIILTVYLTGAVIFTLRFCIQIIQLFGMIKKYGVSRKEGIRMVFTDTNYAPFSFFKYIFLNSKFDEKDREKIIIHESIHVEQGHTYDLLLLEVLTILQWYNPFTWLYRTSLRSIHEYLADNGVLFKGIDKFNYQKLLLSLSLGIQVNDLTNNIRKSLIKRRFSKMIQEKSKNFTSLKYAVVLPAALSLLLLFGMNSSSLQKYSVIKQDSVYTKLDDMPVFPGGDEALHNFLISNVKYPENCRANKIQGKVVVDFIVRKDGKVDEIQISTSVNKELDEEALRVVRLMPDWKPGLMNGKPVDTKLSVPFIFKLS